MKKKRKLMKPVRAWVGLCDGKLLFWVGNDGYGRARHADVFATREEAQARYEDVRHIEIREVAA